MASKILTGINNGKSHVTRKQLVFIYAKKDMEETITKNRVESDEKWDGKWFFERSASEGRRLMPNRPDHPVVDQRSAAAGHPGGLCGRRADGVPPMSALARMWSKGWTTPTGRSALPAPSSTSPTRRPWPMPPSPCSPTARPREAASRAGIARVERYYTDHMMFDRTTGRSMPARLRALPGAALMAGIGFELRRLLREHPDRPGRGLRLRQTSSAPARGCFHRRHPAHRLVQRQHRGASVLVTQFQTSVTYLVASSLILTGLVSGFTRPGWTACLKRSANWSCPICTVSCSSSSWPPACSAACCSSSPCPALAWLTACSCWLASSSCARCGSSPSCSKRRLLLCSIEIIACKI